MKVLSKVWIVSDDDRVIFGEGRLEMLGLIDKLGSMNKAAAKMAMSYRTLWGKIHETEKVLGVKLIETRVGGGRNAGSRLTDDARELMRRYRDLNEDVLHCADKAFFRHFDSIAAGK
jgi:molybdate transport system regulatory protein